MSQRRSLRSLLLMALIGWLGVACVPHAPPSAPKPGCEPGSGLVLAEACEREVENEQATIAECDARVSAWEARCLK